MKLLAQNTWSSEIDYGSWDPMKWIGFEFSESLHQIKRMCGRKVEADVLKVEAFNGSLMAWRAWILHPTEKLLTFRSFPSSSTHTPGGPAEGHHHHHHYNQIATLVLFYCVMCTRWVSPRQSLSVNDWSSAAMVSRYSVLLSRMMLSWACGPASVLSSVWSYWLPSPMGNTDTPVCNKHMFLLRHNAMRIKSKNLKRIILCT